MARPPGSARAFPGHPPRPEVGAAQAPLESLLLPRVPAHNTPRMPSKRGVSGDLPGRPVMRASCSHCRGCGFNPLVALVVGELKSRKPGSVAKNKQKISIKSKPKKPHKKPMKSLNLLPLALCGTQAAPAFKVRCSRGSSSGCQTPRSLECDMWLRTLTPVGEPQRQNSFPVCRSPIQWVWDLIVLGKHLVYCLLVALHLEIGIFFGRFQSFFVCGCSAVVCGCSAVSCHLGVFLAADEHKSCHQPFYLLHPFPLCLDGQGRPLFTCVCVCVCVCV